MFKNKLLGSTLLVIGTSIGGGMLAIPVVTAGEGLLLSVILLVAAWFCMTVGALYMTEVNQWFHQNNNLISMAQHTLGNTAKIVTWLVYLCLLYSLMSAYITGGAGVLMSLGQVVNLSMPYWISALLFAGLLGLIVYRGIYSVDSTNRILLTIKLLAFVGLVVLILLYGKRMPPTVQLHHSTIIPSIGILFASFGFAGSLPTFCSYLNYDKQKIRLSIVIGSSITLIIYIIWDILIKFTIKQSDLLHILHSGHTTQLLTNALSQIAQSGWISSFAHLFTSICMFTSFIGVAIGLVDFLADGMKVSKQNNPIIVFGLTFVPPLFIGLLFPKLFITSLNYAGIFCLILLLFLPCLMVYRGYYVKKLANNKPLLGGKALLLALTSISVILISSLIVFKIVALL